MSRFVCSVRSATLLFAAILLASLPAVAQSSTGTFTISAESVNITSTGSGAIPFTLTSVNGFAGSIIVGCDQPNEPAGVKIPYCGGGPVHLYSLTSGQVLNGSLELFAYGAPVPAGFALAGHPLLTLLVVVAMLSGLTVRRRSARWLALPLALVALIPFSSVVGCGSAPQGFTPGTYTYTLTASEYGSVTPLSKGVNATVTIH